MANEFGGSFKFRLWVTRGCFFVLSDRLKRKGRYSIGAITLLSFYVFAISLVALLFAAKLPQADGLIISLISIVLSVFIIIVTLLENSKEYSLNAELAFQTAHQLENLFNRFEALGETAVAGDNLKFREEYNLILRHARAARKSIDYHQFQLQNRAEFGIQLGRAAMISLTFAGELVVEYWLYATMAVLPLLAISWFIAKIGAILI